MLAIISSCAPIIAYALLAKVGLQKDANANTALTTAITRGTGLLVAAGVKAGDPLLLSAETKSPAMADALAYVQTAAGTAANRLGVSPDLIATKLESQLALTLHTPPLQTPVVNIVAPAIVPAPKAKD
jgi:hypothetical protein